MRVLRLCSPSSAVCKYYENVGNVIKSLYARITKTKLPEYLCLQVNSLTRITVIATTRTVSQRKFVGG